MTDIPGSDYYDFNAPGWIPGQQEQWVRDHPINQETGLVEGPYPLVPAQYARGYQAMSDRIIWQQRQRMMGQGIQYAQGALGLLQSYRPGGSAALESGQYNVLAGLQFDRAANTQPIDLMSDLRRHEAAAYGSSANRAQERNLGVQIGAALINAVASYYAPGAAPLITPLVNAGAGALMQTPQSYQNYQGDRYNADSAESWRRGTQTDLTQGWTDGSTQPDLTQGWSSTGGEDLTQGWSSPAVNGPGQQQQQQNGTQQSVPAQIQQDVQPGQAQPQQGQQRAMQGAQGEGGVDGMGGYVGAGMPGPSAGDFSNTAYAASASMAPSIAQNPMARVHMNNVVADLYERDPFYRTLGYAIDVRWRERLGGAA